MLAFSFFFLLFSVFLLSTRRHCRHVECDCDILSDQPRPGQAGLRVRRRHPHWYPCFTVVVENDVVAAALLLLLLMLLLLLLSLLLLLLFVCYCIAV
jgi:hypothetical protein